MKRAAWYAAAFAVLWSPIALAWVLLVMVSGCGSKPTRSINAYAPDTAYVVMRNGDRIAVAGTHVNTDNQTLRIRREGDFVFVAKLSEVSYVTFSARRWKP